MKSVLNSSFCAVTANSNKRINAVSLTLASWVIIWLLTSVYRAVVPGRKTGFVSVPSWGVPGSQVLDGWIEVPSGRRTDFLTKQGRERSHRAYGDSTDHHNPTIIGIISTSINATITASTKTQHRLYTNHSRQYNHHHHCQHDHDYHRHHPHHNEHPHYDHNWPNT